MGRNSEIVSSKDKKSANIKYATCHVCLKSTKQYAQCSAQRCRNCYCVDCIVQKFNKEFKLQNYAKEYWVCYACGGSCKCLFCTGLGNNRKKRKPKQQVIESVSIQNAQDEQIKQNENDDSEVSSQQNEEQDQKQPNNRKRGRYQRRRLPQRRNIVFKYKTKKRLKSKSEMKLLLQNLKPEDKIYKIKRQQFHKMSDSQSQESQQSSSSQQQKNKKIVQQPPVQKSQNNKQIYKSNQKQKVKQLQKQLQIQNNQKDKVQNQNSSSLQYLEYTQLKDNKQSPNKMDKTKQIRKTKRLTPILQKLPTIQSVQSKKQISVFSKQSIQVQCQKKQNFKKQKIDQTSSYEEQQRPKSGLRRGNRKKRGSRLRYGREQEYSHNYDESSSEKNKPIKKRTRETRNRANVEQTNDLIQKKPLTSRQVKQLRDLMGGNYERPKRKQRKNYAQIEQALQMKMIKDQKKQKRVQEEQQIKVQYEQKKKDSSKQILNKNLEFSENQKQNVISSQRSQDSNENEDEEDNGQQIQENNKQKKKNVVNVKYQQQIQRIGKQCVDNSSSLENSEQQIQEQKNQVNQQIINQNQSNQKVQQKSQNQNGKNSSNTRNKIQPENDLKNTQNKQGKASIIETRKSSQLNSAANVAHEVQVYRKVSHHKKSTNQTGNEGINAKVHTNQIAIKWNQIPDSQLIDIRNIQKLGFPAMFARQNLRKQMNELIKRRTELIEKMKKSNEVRKQIKILNKNETINLQVK